MTRAYTLKDAQRFAKKIEPLFDKIDALGEEEADTIDDLVMTTLLLLGKTALLSVGIEGTAVLTGTLKTAFYLGYKLGKQETPDPDVWFGEGGKDGPGS